MTNSTSSCILQNATINGVLIVGNININQVSDTTTLKNTTINNNLKVSNIITCNQLNTSTITDTQLNALENKI